MMLLHTALQVLLEYRHIFYSEENAVPYNFLLQLLCVQAMTSTALYLGTLALPQPLIVMMLEIVTSQEQFVEASEQEYFHILCANIFH